MDYLWDMQLKQLLINQLKSSHNKANWFVPLNIALKGLSAEEANWKPKGADHSIAELTTHIVFWNENELFKFSGENKFGFSGDNEETFMILKNKSWLSLVTKADDIMLKWENAIEDAEEEKLETWSEIIAHISAHNAYHTGQIVYIRKLQGSWDPERGVK